MSIERSRKDSSREETVSHVRHRVSLVRTPSNSLWTIVDDEELDPVETGGDIRELETEKRVQPWGDIRRSRGSDLNSRSDSGALLRSSSISSTMRFSR